MPKEIKAGRTGRKASGKSDETRGRILDSALLLFRKQGFEQTTMRQIAAEAGMAVGAAYYYFQSKQAIVMAFYERAQDDLGPLLDDALPRHKKLDARLRALLEVKFRYFEPDRQLLGALAAHVNPRHPLSPFSAETRAIRDRDIGYFARAIEDAGVRVPDDLTGHLPRVLWMYQMGLLLFWVYDDSPEQARTRQLTQRSLAIVVGLIKLSGLPLMRRMRRQLVDLLLIASGEAAQSKAERS